MDPVLFRAGILLIPLVGSIELVTMLDSVNARDFFVGLCSCTTRSRFIGLFRKLDGVLGDERHRFPGVNSILGEPLPNVFSLGLKAEIGLMHDDVLLISLTTKPHIQNANVFPEDRN